MRIPNEWFDRDAEKGSAFEQQLGDVEALFVPADVSIETDAARFIDETVLRLQTRIRLSSDEPLSRGRPGTGSRTRLPSRPQPGPRRRTRRDLTPKKDLNHRGTETRSTI